MLHEIPGSGRPVGRTTRKLIEKARRQTQAGKYKAALDTLIRVEPNMRSGEDDIAHELLDLATELRDHTSGWDREECERIVENARRIACTPALIANRLGPLAVGFEPALCVGVYPQSSEPPASGRAGILWFSTEWVGIGTTEGDLRAGGCVSMSDVESIEVRRGTSTVYWAPFYVPVIPLGKTANNLVTDVVVHTRDEGLVFFRVGNQAPRALQDAITPLLESVGVPSISGERADEEARAWKEPAKIGHLATADDCNGKEVTLVSAPSGEHFLLDGAEKITAADVIRHALRSELVYESWQARGRLGLQVLAARDEWLQGETPGPVTPPLMDELFADGLKCLQDGGFEAGFTQLDSCAAWALAHYPDELFDVLSLIPKDDRAPFETGYRALLSWSSYCAGANDELIERVRDCSVLGCSDETLIGLDVKLLFKENGIYLVEMAQNRAELFGPRLFSRYEDVVALVVGESRKTTICVQTKNAELFLRSKVWAPDKLRMHLAAVFTHLRQKQVAAAPQASPVSAPDPPPASAAPGDLVSQLAKLSDLHDAGKLTDEQFEAFKAKLMK